MVFPAHVTQEIPQRQFFLHTNISISVQSLELQSYNKIDIMEMLLKKDFI